MVRGTVRALKISRGGSVSRSRAREFRCPVVQETVEIRLRRSGGFGRPNGYFVQRSEEHTSELQSQSNLVCRLLLEKKKDARLDVVGGGHQAVRGCREPVRQPLHGRE